MHTPETELQTLSTAMQVYTDALASISPTGAPGLHRVYALAGAELALDAAGPSLRRALAWERSPQRVPEAQITREAEIALASVEKAAAKLRAYIECGKAAQ